MTILIISDKPRVSRFIADMALSIGGNIVGYLLAASIFISVSGLYRFFIDLAGGFVCCGQCLHLLFIDC